MSSIHDLAAVDLNLLVALSALEERRSVTEAAAALGVTQSAMSHTLRRLRDLLGDPLFVRSGRGMEPTPLALALAGPVRAHLEGLARALASPGAFDAATSERRFALASIDLFDRVVLPRLLPAVRREAPGVRVVLRSHGGSTVEGLDQGRLDAAIHPVLDGPDPLPRRGLRQRTLLREGFAMFCRADHVDRAALGSDLDCFCGAGHVLVSPRGGPGLVDAQLAAQGRSRRVVLELPGFAAALDSVAASDLVLVAPASLARLAPSEVAVSEPPLPLPEHRVTLVWPERLHDDAGHRWFREQLVAAVGR